MQLYSNKDVKKKRKMRYIYTIEYQLAIKKEQIVPFAQTWMELDIAIQSEVSQKEKNRYCKYCLYVEFRKMLEMNLFERQKQRHRCREKMYGYQGGKGWGGRNWEIGVDTYTVLILCIKQTTEGNILYSTGNST